MTFLGSVLLAFSRSPVFPKGRWLRVLLFLFHGFVQSNNGHVRIPRLAFALLPPLQLRQLFFRGSVEVTHQHFSQKVFLVRFLGHRRALPTADGPTDLQVRSRVPNSDLSKRHNQPFLKMLMTP